MKRALLISVLVIVVGSLAAQAQRSGTYAGVSNCWNGREFVYVRGNCPSTSSGEHGIMGPPVIVWRHPSAEGSQMPGLSPVDSRLASQLNAIADTPTTLRQKCEFAMKNGDLGRAKLFCEEANRRDPLDPDIQQSMAKLQNLFNGAQSLTVPRLQLPKQEFLKPMPASIVDKYMADHPGDTTVKALWQSEIDSYNKLAEADFTFNTMTNSQAGTATQSDIDQAQSKLNSAAEEFKKAETKLQEKIYVLDPTTGQN